MDSGIKALRMALMSVFLAFLVGCAGHRTTAHTFKSQPPGSLRVVSYNVNWQKGKETLQDEASVIEALQVVRGDLLLLQEVTPAWEKVLATALVAPFPYYSFYHYKNAGGLAIFSRYPFYTLKKLAPSYGWHPAWIVAVQTSQGVVQVMNTHLIPPLNKQSSVGFMANSLFNTLPNRKREIAYLYQQLRQDWPTLVVGDFNEEANGVAADFLRHHGFQDVLVQHSKKTYTWCWSLLGVLHISAKLDDVYYKPISRFTVLQAQVLHQGSSDHYPVVVDLIVNK